MAELPPPITSPTVDAIDAAITRGRQSFPNVRLSGSMIGEECDAKKWHAFRWTHDPEVFEARLLRIFEFGHVYEPIIIGWLRAAGLIVDEGSLNDKGKMQQVEWTGLGGHFVDRLDGEVFNVPEAPTKLHALEIKTHSDKSFKAVVKNGVQSGKPEHYTQCQMHMHGRGLDRCLYVAVNKNDMTIFIERIRYDGQFALITLAKAEQIITSDRPGPKLHEDPDKKMAFKCRSCPALQVCHRPGENAPPRNCRTCLHSTPLMSGDDGAWECAHWKRLLSREDQKRGCQHHLYLPALVPGEQVDANPEEEWVEYKLHDGRTFIDGFERKSVAVGEAA